MSERAAATVRAAIEDHGPISFAEFMELALYGPGGFYERPPVGSEGDFVTSPHVHPVFGHLVAGTLREVWEALGRPEPFAVVEVGAGDGTLARQLLEALDELPVAYVAVERSEGARGSLEGLAEAGLPVRVTADLSEAGPIERGVVLANELLDNLPFRRVRGSPDGLREIRVALDADGRLIEVEAPCGPELAGLAPELGPGEEGVVPTGALGFVDELARALRHGLALLIDYGGVGPVTGSDAVHGYRGQRVIEDVLADPGTADITAGVDLGAVARRAEAGGLVAAGPVSQREALTALGFEAWARGALERQGEQLRSGAGIEAVRTWSERGRASLLVDPAGLGRLRWLVLRTPDVPTPGWLA